MALSDSASALGFAPVTQQVTDFQFGEQPGQAVGGVAYKRLGQCPGVDLNVPSFLFRRKIYGWIWAANSNATNFAALCSIIFLLNKTPVGKLPLSHANQSGTNTLQSSVPVLFSSSTNTGVVSSSQDTLYLYLVNAINGQPDNAAIQPLYLFGKFDEAIVNVDYLLNVTDLRVWLGIASSL